MYSFHTIFGMCTIKIKLNLIIRYIMDITPTYESVQTMFQNSNKMNRSTFWICAKCECRMIIPAGYTCWIAYYMPIIIWQFILQYVYCFLCIFILIKYIFKIYTEICIIFFGDILLILVSMFLAEHNSMLNTTRIIVK